MIYTPNGHATSVHGLPDIVRTSNVVLQTSRDHLAALRMINMINENSVNSVNFHGSVKTMDFGERFLADSVTIMIAVIIS